MDLIESAARPAARGKGEAAFLAVSIALLALPIAALAYRSTLQSAINYNEGWNAFFTSFVLRGQALYYPPEALLTNNYPPLSFFVVAPLAALLGDALFAGRLVAWIAFAVVALSIAGIIARLHREFIAAAFAALVFVGYMVVNYDIYVGMDDPQMLAHALVLLGLGIYVRHGDRRWSSMAAALLMCCGLFAKHNIIALPLAFAGWLAVHDGAACRRFVATGLVVGLAGLALCLACFGPVFFTSLLSPRPYLVVRAWRHIVEWTAPLEVPLILAALAGAPGLRDRYSRFFVTYLVLALLLGYAAAGGDATNFNLLFDAVIAMALASGHLIGQLARFAAGRRFRLWVMAAYAFSAVATAGLVGTKDAFLIGPWIAAQQRKEAAMRAAIEVVARRPGRAICEQLALCYWAGKDMELDTLNYSWGLAAGKKDPRLVLDRVAAGDYGSIEIAAERSYLPPPLIAAIEANYRRAPLPAWILFLPP